MVRPRFCGKLKIKSPSFSNLWPPKTHLLRGCWEARLPECSPGLGWAGLGWAGLGWTGLGALGAPEVFGKETQGALCRRSSALINGLGALVNARQRPGSARQRSSALVSGLGAPLSAWQRPGSAHQRSAAAWERSSALGSSLGALISGLGALVSARSLLALLDFPQALEE